MGHRSLLRFSHCELAWRRPGRLATRTRVGVCVSWPPAFGYLGAVSAGHLIWVHLVQALAGQLAHVSAADNLRASRRLVPGLQRGDLDGTSGTTPQPATTPRFKTQLPWSGCCIGNSIRTKSSSP